MTAKSRPWKAILGGLAVTALLALYAYVLGVLGFDLLRSGSAVGVVLGAALLLIPLFAVWATVREWLMGLHVDRMSQQLAAEGALPVDTLERTPGGRVVRASADAQFEQYQHAVEANPESWRDWFRLALAYDACGDRRRARASFRKAAALQRAA
ncbi:hypothetical protein JT358_02210 [Micrococcales bacterium 31B]|nr:hypothetical protein [Micrococcales bacterium 31B]